MNATWSKLRDGSRGVKVVGTREQLDSLKNTLDAGGPFDIVVVTNPPSEASTEQLGPVEDFAFSGDTGFLLCHVLKRADDSKAPATVKTLPSLAELLANHGPLFIQPLFIQDVLAVDTIIFSVTRDPADIFKVDFVALRAWLGNQISRFDDGSWAQSDEATLTKLLKGVFPGGIPQSITDFRAVESDKTFRNWEAYLTQNRLLLFPRQMSHAEVKAEIEAWGTWKQSQTPSQTLTNQQAAALVGFEPPRQNLLSSTGAMGISEWGSVRVTDNLESLAKEWAALKEKSANIKKSLWGFYRDHSDILNASKNSAEILQWSTNWVGHLIKSQGDAGKAIQKVGADLEVTHDLITRTETYVAKERVKVLGPVKEDTLTSMGNYWSTVCGTEMGQWLSGLIKETTPFLGTPKDMGAHYHVPADAIARTEAFIARSKEEALPRVTHMSPPSHRPHVEAYIQREQKKHPYLNSDWMREWFDWLIKGEAEIIKDGQGGFYVRGRPGRHFALSEDDNGEEIQDIVRLERGKGVTNTPMSPTDTIEAFAQEISTADALVTKGDPPPLSHYLELIQDYIATPAWATWTELSKNIPKHRSLRLDTVCAEERTKARVAKDQDRGQVPPEETIRNLAKEIAKFRGDKNDAYYATEIEWDLSARTWQSWAGTASDLPADLLTRIDSFTRLPSARAHYIRTSPVDNLRDRMLAKGHAFRARKAPSDANIWEYQVWSPKSGHAQTQWLRNPSTLGINEVTDWVQAQLPYTGLANSQEDLKTLLYEARRWYAGGKWAVKASQDSIMSLPDILREHQVVIRADKNENDVSLIGLWEPHTGVWVLPPKRATYLIPLKECLHAQYGVEWIPSNLKHLDKELDKAIEDLEIRQGLKMTVTGFLAENDLIVEAVKTDTGDVWYGLWDLETEKYSVDPCSLPRLKDRIQHLCGEFKWSDISDEGLTNEDQLSDEIEFAETKLKKAIQQAQVYMGTANPSCEPATGIAQQVAKKTKTQRVMATAKTEAGRAANRVAARQLAKAVRDPLLEFLTQVLGANKRKAMAFLASPSGLAITKLLLGTGLGMLPMSQYQDTGDAFLPANKLALIASVMRDDGMADLGDNALDLITSPLFKRAGVLLATINAMADEPAVGGEKAVEKAVEKIRVSVASEDAPAKKTKRVRVKVEPKVEEPELEFDEIEVELGEMQAS